MNNLSARVLFSACLAAAAAAQAPASLASNSSLTNPSWLTGPGVGLRLQDGDDYSLRSVFQKAHGEFLLRSERYDPQIEVKGSWFPSANMRDEPGNFDILMSEVDIDLAAPIYPDQYLIFGAYGTGRRYMTSSAFQLADDTLYEVGAHVGFGAFIDDNLLFELRSNPGAWSDLDGTIHGKDIDLPSSAVLTMRSGDNFFWQVGAAYSQVYEDAPWLPVLGVHWEVFDGFRVDIDLPRNIELSFWPSSSTGFLFGANAQGGQYHVRNSLALGHQRADVQIQEITAYAGISHRMNENMSLFGRVGVVLSGDYELGDGTPGNTVEGDLDQTVFFQVGFGFDF